ncbi:hypothetical protein DRQ07_01610 [candidate division KSB1 bacterium]|nr:MAG: hypothetical protein DRQ07_01610 [candidate division KSB1 bacterium]
MNKYNSKKTVILSTGKDLFWKYGIKRVSVEEICKESNVSKMTFYKYFKNKVDLVKTIMIDLMEQGLDEYREIMQSRITFKEKLEGIIQLKIKNSENISFEILNDLYSDNFPELKSFIEKKSAENLKIFMNDLKTAQKRGEIREDLNLKFVTYILNESVNIIKNDKFRSFFSNAQDMIKSTVELLVYGIIKRD